VINQQLKPHEVESSGIELRMMSVALDNGALVAVDEKGDIWTAARGQRLQRNGASTTLVQGVMASSAMPAMLPHEKVGSLTCVDAGIKEGVPVSVAVDDLGASTVYAIMCSAEVAPVANASQMCALSVFARGITLIPFVEISDDDVRPYGGWPPDVDVIVIQPSFDIHDGMVIEPGLIRIAYDYGWMRAADVLDPPAGNANAARNACDRIIRARAQAWEWEHKIYGKPYKSPWRDPFSHILDEDFQQETQPPLMFVAANEVRRLKVEVRDALRERAALGAKLPSMWRGWFEAWELHGTPPAAPLPPSAQQGWTPPDASPWVQITTPGGVLPAATVPAP
jgi:hypothetical protein